MIILVTGGAGFIGSHVADNLRTKAHKVTILDRHYPAPSLGYDGAILGDVKDRELVMNAVSSHDGIIHLAALLGTQETIEVAEHVIQTDIVGSLNVFDACKKYEKKGVYIGVGNYWMNNPYSICKTAAERFALMYNKEFGTQIAVVRGLNAYGPRQKAKPVRKVVPNFVLPALKSEDLIVYGSGNQIMDMIYVEDLAEILVRALIIDHGEYQRVIDAGMGRDTTINELAEVVLQQSGSHSKVKHVNMRPGEVPDSVVKAKMDTLECLNFSAKDMTPLREGIRKTIQWYAQQV